MNPKSGKMLKNVATTFDSAFQKFSTPGDRISFRDIQQERSVIWKCLWVATVLFGLGLSTYQIYILVNQYIHEPFATNIRTLDLSYELPAIWFGYPLEEAWNQSAYQSMFGDQQPPSDNEAFLYLSSLMDFQPLPVNLTTVNLDTVRRRLRRLLDDQNLTYPAELYMRLLDVQQLPYTRLVQGKVRLLQATADREYVFFLFSMKGAKSEPQFRELVFQFDERSPLLKAWLDPYDNVEMINRNHYTMVEYRLTKMKRISTVHHPCDAQIVHNFTYTVEFCASLCAKRHWRERFPHKLCFPLDLELWGNGIIQRPEMNCFAGIRLLNDTETIGASDLSHSYTVKEEDMRLAASMKTACLKSCIPPCEQWNVDVRIRSQQSILQPSETLRQLIFRFPHEDTITVFEQTKSFTVEKFLGEAGGILGLWLGFSILSIVESLYLCFLSARSIKK